MPLQSGFQSFVNNELPPAVAGDFASANPNATALGPQQGFAAAPGGVIQGTFAWGNPATGLASNYYQQNSILGFVRRQMGNALITNFLGYASTVIPTGNNLALFDQGEFWGLFSGGCTVGQKVYCDPYYGTLTGNATGNGVTANSTAASLANTGILTVGATLTGTLAPGQAVYGTGIPAGSYVSSQISGSTGSTGTYQLANAVTIASGSWPVVTSETVYFQGVFETPFYCSDNVPVAATFTAALAAPVAPAVNGILTVSAVAAGVLAAGQWLTATGGGGLLAGQNVQILSQLTATTPTTGGGTGTYLVSYNGSTAVTSTNTFVGGFGQLGKISSWQ